MNQCKFLSLVTIFSAYGLAAQAATPCPSRAWINDDFFNKYSITIQVNEPIALRADSRLDFINSDSKWKRYWGTAIRTIISHNEGKSQIPAGSTLTVKSSMHADGNGGSVLSSEMNVFLLENNSSGVESIQVFTQPYSGIRVKKLEGHLGISLFCETK